MKAQSSIKGTREGLVIALGQVRWSHSATNLLGT